MPAVRNLPALCSCCGRSGCLRLPDRSRKANTRPCQSQNRTLTEQTKAQLAEIENLKIHARHVEDQLIRAEEDLARLEQQSGRGEQVRTSAARFPRAERPADRPGRALSQLAIRSENLA